MTKSNKTKPMLLPGDEWLYYKIYTGPRTADKLLTDIINPLAKELTKEQLIDKWFFIRYGDPNYHIRLRFHLRDNNKAGYIMTSLNSYLSKFIKNDLIWNIQLNTYEREMERYGSNSIELCEDIFHSDSKYIIEMIDLFVGDQVENYKWQFSILAIDALLDKFNFDMQMKYDLLDSMQEDFGKEFNVNKMQKKQLDTKYRDERSKINALFEKKDEDEVIPYLVNLTTKFGNEIDSTAKDISAMYDINNDKSFINSLMRSIIHMHCNRVFKSKQRMQEFVVYYLMFKHYKSFIAQQKYNPSIQH